MTAYRIVLSYAVFMIEVEQVHVRAAAPIASWMVGKSLTAVTRWVESKKGTITCLSKDAISPPRC